MARIVSTKLRDVRIAMGFNSVEVAHGSGLNKVTYSKIETKRSSARPKTAKKICGFLNKPFDELFEVVEEET